MTPADARLRRLGLARSCLLILGVGSALIGGTLEGRFLDPPTAAIGDYTHRHDIKGHVVYLTDLQSFLYQWTPALFMASISGAILCDISRWWLRRRRG
jgi:hypothetical protein